MDEVGSQVDLLVSLLVRYPEIGAVHYEPQEKALRFIYLVRDGEESSDLAFFPDIYKSHLSIFHKLKKTEPSVNSLKVTHNSQLAVLEIRRDLATLSIEELNLSIELLRDCCGAALVREGQADAAEDEWEHNDLIEALLAAASLVGPERLTGFRQDGRVLVFSMPLAGVSK
ncbi:MAG TPA: hypothetical protein GX521_05590 [Firmicutes bacterium]|nr:hypothetical protein [Bacillota bacterium]